MQTRFWTRLSFVALALALLAGVFAGGVLTRANAEAQNSKIDAEMQKAIDEAVKKALETPPTPRRTAYVDFLNLLKQDAPLKRKQQEIALNVEKRVDDIDRRWLVQIDAQQKIKTTNKVDSRAYRQAMQKQLEFERKRYQEKLELEQIAQADLRDYGIERFKALRNLARDIAKKQGYNEVLNIVRDIEDVAGNQDDFQALQQQLLVSPVLYFEAEHDITDIVDKQAQAEWGETISFIEWDDEAKRGGVTFTLKDEEGKETLVKRNADGEIEVRLGQKGAFKITVLDKGEPAAADRAQVRWTKGGANSGDLSEDTGEYEAPEEFPLNDTFVVTARSAVDPTVTERVKIRLLDKDGNPKPAEEENKEPEDPPSED